MPQRIDKLRSIVVHHSASARDTTISQIREWHKDRGFLQVGYHYVIEGNGALRYGRPLDMIPAAQRGANTHTIAVCITGNNTIADHQWNDSQRFAFRRLVEDLRRVIGRPLPVLGHRDVADPDFPTVCPGAAIAAAFPGINETQTQTQGDDHGIA